MITKFTKYKRRYRSGRCGWTQTNDEYIAVWFNDDQEMYQCVEHCRQRYGPAGSDRHAYPNWTFNPDTMTVSFKLIPDLMAALYGLFKYEVMSSSIPKDSYEELRNWCESNKICHAINGISYSSQTRGVQFFPVTDTDRMLIELRWG